jgi:hypothetical protein
MNHSTSENRGQGSGARGQLYKFETVEQETLPWTCLTSDAFQDTNKIPTSGKIGEEWGTQFF